MAYKELVDLIEQGTLVLSLDLQATIPRLNVADIIAHRLHDCYKCTSSDGDDYTDVELGFI